MTLIRLHAARSDLFAYLPLSLSFSPCLFLCLYFSVCMSVTSSYFCIPPFVRLNVDNLPMSVSNFIYIAKFCSIRTFLRLFLCLYIISFSITFLSCSSLTSTFSPYNALFIISLLFYSFQFRRYNLYLLIVCWSFLCIGH